MDDVILNYIALNYHNGKKLIHIHSRQLDKFQLVRMNSRGRDHGSIIGIYGKKFRYLLQKLIHLVFLLNHNFLHFFDLTILLLHHRINI